MQLVLFEIFNSAASAIAAASAVAGGSLGCGSFLIVEPCEENS